MVSRRGFIVGLGSSAVFAQGISVVDFNARGDGVSDDTQAFKDALDVGGDIYVPPGRYLIKEPLHVKKTVNLVGPSGTMEGDYSATLVCEGIVIHRHNTNSDAYGNMVIEPSSTRADGSTIRHLHLTGGSGHGVWLKARAKLVDCKVSGFSGNGVHVVAAANSSDPLLHGNANNFSLSNVRSVGNGGHGVYIDGPDVNVGDLINVDSTSNGGFGFFDSGFLGNSYFSCHAANNKLGAYKTDNVNARHLFLGCYSEGGQPPSQLVAPSIVVGGLWGSGFTEDTTATILSGGHPLKSTSVEFESNKESSRDFGVQLTGLPDEAITCKADGDHVRGLSWVWDEPSKQWQWKHARAGWRVAQSITTELSDLRAGRVNKVDAGNSVFPRGAFFGSGNYARNITFSHQPPIKEEHARGDIVFNIYPLPGGFVGWSCVVGGTPGVWKGFGRIDG